MLILFKIKVYFLSDFLNSFLNLVLFYPYFALGLGGLAFFDVLFLLQNLDFK